MTDTTDRELLEGSAPSLCALVEQRCPLRISRDASAGCCTWDTFLTGYAEAWPRWFDTPPTLQQWQMAKRDWRAGNTGWEAAHNAQRRAKDRVRTGAVYGIDAKAMATDIITRAAASMDPAPQRKD